MTSVMNRRRVQRHQPVATVRKTAKVGAVKTDRRRCSRSRKVIVSCISGLLGTRHPGGVRRPRIGAGPMEVAIPHAYGTCSRTTKPELSGREDDVVALPAQRGDAGVEVLEQALDEHR